MHALTAMRAALLAPLCASLAFVAGEARAGGGPMNVVVLYNADVPAAVAVATHYAEARSLPAGHLCGLHGILATDTTITQAVFASMVQAPLDACIAALPEPGLVDYVVLVRGLPYSVTLPSYAASLQAMVQVRHAKAIAGGAEIASGGQPGGNDATVANPMFPAGFAGNAADFTMSNPYETWYENATVITSTASQPAAFHSANAPADGGGYTVTTTDAGTGIEYAAHAYDWSGGNLVIVSALDGFDYADATALVDRAVASDGTFPTAEILCMQGADSSRGARDPECAYATSALAGAGLPGTFVTPFDGTLSGHTVAAYFTGAASLSGAIAGNTYVPGAITDNLTSYGAAISNFFCDADGGVCPESEAQTSIARFVRAGATGAHGTVNEPLNNAFPNAGALLLYTFGYSMGESYFFNQRFLYWQNIYLGDPLATPYATRPVVTIGGAGADAGVTSPANQPIVVHATHPSGVASITLYESGRQVASANADTLDYMPTEAVGASLDLMAVAVANDVPVTRTGWTVAQHQPHAQVQGWLAATVTLGADVASPEPSGDDGGGGDLDASADATHPANEASGGSSGCSCRQAPGGDAAGSLGAAALGLVALARRRRRVSP